MRTENSFVPDFNSSKTFSYESLPPEIEAVLKERESVTKGYAQDTEFNFGSARIKNSRAQGVSAVRFLFEIPRQQKKWQFHSFEHGIGRLVDEYFLVRRPLAIDGEEVQTIIARRLIEETIFSALSHSIVQEEAAVRQKIDAERVDEINQLESVFSKDAVLIKERALAAAKEIIQSREEKIRREISRNGELGLIALLAAYKTMSPKNSQRIIDGEEKQRALLGLEEENKRDSLMALAKITMALHLAVVAPEQRKRKVISDVAFSAYPEIDAFQLEVLKTLNQIDLPNKAQFEVYHSIYCRQLKKLACSYQDSMARLVRALEEVSRKPCVDLRANATLHAIAAQIRMILIGFQGVLSGDEKSSVILLYEACQRNRIDFMRIQKALMVHFIDPDLVQPLNKLISEPLLSGSLKFRLLPHGVVRTSPFGVSCFMSFSSAFYHYHLLLAIWRPASVLSAHLLREIQVKMEMAKTFGLQILDMLMQGESLLSVANMEDFAAFFSFNPQLSIPKDDESALITQKYFSVVPVLNVELPNLKKVLDHHLMRFLALAPTAFDAQPQASRTPRI